MPSPQQPKLVLITGATGGIGKATAIAFAKEGGYNLALHYNSASTETRDAIFSSIAASARAPDDISIAFFQADLSSYDSVRALHASVTKSLGDVSILFNNAGTTGGLSPVQSLADVSIEAFESTWRVNTGAGILLTQLCLPYMEQQGWGRIIFDSSVAGFTGGVVGPHYASSKAAIHGFVHWLAGNVAKKGVTVNAVAPALIGETAMVGGVEEEKLAARIPVGRLGRPEEIADTVLWMAKTAYLTNKVIGVDGGYYPY